MPTAPERSISAARSRQFLLLALQLSRLASEVRNDACASPHGRTRASDFLCPRTFLYEVEPLLSLMQLRRGAIRISLRD